jgi:ubiquinol oxidase
VPAPQITIDYWKLHPSALLRDAIVVLQAFEVHHRDVNHHFANDLKVKVA